MRRASALTAPSGHLAREVEHELRFAPGRVVVIPNAIDVTEFAPAVGPGGHPRRPPHVLFVGRISDEKGVFVLADALHLLASRGAAIGAGTSARWIATFAGEDRGLHGVSNTARLRTFFEDRGLADRVTMRGFVPQEELVSLYRSADICVVPSTFYESFSYTCLQAMACGKPVIATTMGGIPEVVLDGETGLLVPPGDAASLAESLARLFADPSLREQLGAAGRKRAVNCYSAESVARENLALYLNVSGERTCR
jgi:glycosyltransferase involved in cell wall biosynthesis